MCCIQRFTKCTQFLPTQHVSKLGFFTGSPATLYAFFCHQQVTDFYSNDDTFHKEINFLMFCIFFANLQEDNRVSKCATAVSEFVKFLLMMQQLLKSLDL